MDLACLQDAARESVQALRDSNVGGLLLPVAEPGALRELFPSDAGFSGAGVSSTAPGKHFWYVWDFGCCEGFGS